MKTHVFNKRWILFAFVFVALIALGVWTLDEEPGISISVIILGVLLLCGYVFAFPICYVIHSQGITVYYACGMIKKKATWNELKCVEDHYSRYGILPWWREYQIGYFKTKFPPWEKVCISKNKKTARLIENYSGKKIETYG